MSFIGTGLTLGDLKTNGRKLFRSGGRQILLINADSRTYAIANRCPHEGYPLSEGTLGPGCLLTCNWHNWKFDLRSGEALIGRDPVRTYPLQFRGDEIFIDLADPPAEAQRHRALKGLETAIADNDFARMAREVARLERAGFDGSDAFVHAIDVQNARLEGGLNHAHAAGADWLALSKEATSDDARLAALLEPIGHLAWDTQGAGEFPYAAAIEPWDEGHFLAAMENEEEAVAIAQIRGAIAAGTTYGSLRPFFARAALAHYADFGHSAIYTLKAGQLIERLGADVAEPVLLALVRQLVQARREDRLPEFRFYAKARAEWHDAGRDRAVVKDFIGLPVEKILRRTLASSARPPGEIFDALLGAAGWNMLHFDLTYDRAADNPLADNVSWLDFTHAITFANAVRHLCEEQPALWPDALLQMALFAGRNVGYVAAQQRDNTWRVDDARAFVAREKQALFDHGIVEPIIACHRLKVLFALDDEMEAAPDAPWRDDVLAAVNRYLNSPIKRHHGLRTAAQARDFIARES
jgi:nitrite reductase/ring-hydroxylating ferredoxin subunit